MAFVGLSQDGCHSSFHIHHGVESEPPNSRTVLPLAEVWKQILGIDEVSLRVWNGLGE